MLKSVYALKDLQFSSLMAVYEESNRDNGEEFYPNLPPEQQLLCAEQDFYQYLRTGFFNRDGDVCCIWVENGVYVSALRLQKFEDGLLLEGLETHPQYRGRGYAKKLIAAVIEQRSCDKIYVHISRKNIASIAAHTACGFQKIRDYARYADGSVLHHSDTWLYEKTTLD